MRQMPQEKAPTLSLAYSTISWKHLAWESHVSTYTLTTTVGKTMVAYFMRRVLTGLHKEITFSFLIVGHTKFAPDT